MVINLCQTFHCTPGQLEDESAEIVRLMNIYSMGRKDKSGEEDLGEE